MADANLTYVVSHPFGQIQLCGPSRGYDDSPREGFAAQLSGQGRLYGEWRAIFFEDGNTFLVEVVSFGYALKANLGAPAVSHRYAFTPEDVDRYIRLILSLFHNKEATHRRFLFSSPKSHFTEEVVFREDWIVKAAKSCGDQSSGSEA